MFSFFFPDTQDVSPPVVNNQLYESSPRLIVRLLIYAEKRENCHDNIAPDVINEEFPLHVIYEEESGKPKKDDN